MSKEEAGQRIALIEQNLHSLTAQKQQFQAQLFELEAALKELQTTQTAYKIVGGIMMGANKEELSKELQSRKEMFELRIQTLEKQEKQLREKSKKIQEESK